MKKKGHSPSPGAPPAHQSPLSRRNQGISEFEEAQSYSYDSPMSPSSNHNPSKSPNQASNRSSNPGIQSPGLNSHKNSTNNPKAGKAESKNTGKISRVREQGIDIRQSKAPKRSQAAPISQQDQYQPNNEIKSNQMYDGKRENLNSQRQEHEDLYTPQQEKIKVLNGNMERLSQSLIDLRENYNKLEQEEEIYEQRRNNSQLKSKLSSHLPHNHPVLVGKPSKESQSPMSKSPKDRALANSIILTKSRPPKPESHEEVLKFLLEKQREKEQRRKIMQRQMERQQKKIEQDEKQKAMNEEEYLKWRQNQIRKASQFDQKHKKQKESQEQGKKIVEEYKKKWEGKEHLHKKKQKQFEERIQAQMLENKSNIISKKKQIYKPHSLQEIQQHQKWFFAKKAELEQLKKSEQQGKLQKIASQNDALPQKWHGNAHDLVAEQLKLIKLKKKEPKVRAQKIKDYKQYVRDNFSPRVHKSSSAHQDNHVDDPKHFMKVKRYRYYKGHSYGEIQQTQPIAKDAQEIRRIGKGNLQFMKKIPKKRYSAPSQPQENSYMQQPQRKFDAQLVRKIFSDVVQSHHQKQKQVIVPQHIKVEDIKTLMSQLRFNDKKIQQKQKSLNAIGRIQAHQGQQNQINKSMVDNIQKKLSLLEQL